VKTYTIGFFEREFDEAVFARKVAHHLGTDHTELYVSPEEAREVIPRLPEIYDEPFADYSQIPTFLISQLTRKYVTVALSGDGGDELFGGYNRYSNTPSIWNMLRYVPKFSRGLLARALRVIPVENWDALGSLVHLIFPRHQGKLTDGDKVQRFAELMESTDLIALYRMIISHWAFPNKVVKDGQEPSTFFDNENENFKVLDDYQKMMFADLMTYLPDDILTKVDRASMAVGLEARVPILDHRVIEFSWKIPTGMKFRNGEGKWILRQVLYRYVHPELIERGKMGFSLPMDSWLRDPLREWAEELLNPNRLKDDGFFDPQIIRESWKEHLSGERNLGFKLWNVLMFQAWLDRWLR
jgi:asparagine synthase (glutamine-hydrolysing)